MPTDDTIAAIASAAGGAARGIVRISGPVAAACVDGFVKRRHAPTIDEPGAAHVDTGLLTLPDVAAPVPCDLFIWPDERSYTRQPAVELHLPGSPPLVAAALEAACRHGARPAAPGEFTLRAFLAGRLDLTQAEAVLGVVDASDRRQLDVALRQMAGGLAAPLDRVRNALLDLLAHLEAGLDFVEEDIEFVTHGETLRQLAAARAAVAAVAAQAAARGDATERLRVTLIGLPNVGKSSLFNALSQCDGALVSSQAGTTRDYLTAVCRLGEVECDLIDTAGIEAAIAAGPSIAAAAQSAAVAQSRNADIRVLCIDGSRPPNDWEIQRLAEPDPRRIVVLTKSDLSTRPHAIEGIAVSARTGHGLDALRSAIGDVCATHNQTDVVAATAVRCRDSLSRAAANLTAAHNLAEQRGGDELIALELRAALDELGRVVGAVYTDDILDRIFSRFCIGK